MKITRVTDYKHDPIDYAIIECEVWEFYVIKTALKLAAKYAGVNPACEDHHNYMMDKMAHPNHVYLNTPY